MLTITLASWMFGSCRVSFAHSGMNEDLVWIIWYFVQLLVFLFFFFCQYFPILWHELWFYIAVFCNFMPWYAIPNSASASHLFPRKKMSGSWLCTCASWQWCNATTQVFAFGVGGREILCIEAINVNDLQYMRIRSDFYRPFGNWMSSTATVFLPQLFSLR